MEDFGNCSILLVHLQFPWTFPIPFHLTKLAFLPLKRSIGIERQPNELFKTSAEYLRFLGTKVEGNNYNKLGILLAILNFFGS